MNKDDLMKLLKVKPSSKPLLNKVMRGSDLVQDKTEPGNTQPQTPYALELDFWDMAQGDKLLRHNHQARETKLPAEALSDFHAAAFLAEPALSENPCEDKRRKEYVTTLLETPTYQGLHRSTEHNPVASELAAIEFAQGYAKLVENDEKRKEKQQKEQQQGKKPDPGKEQAQAEMACLKAVGGAVKQAEEKVEEYDDMCKALGMGSGPGSNQNMDVGKIAAIFQRVKDNRQLKRIMELAGRFRLAAQSKQRQKVNHGFDDLVGITLSDDIGNILPHELGLLATPEFELDFMRRLVEKQMLCRQYKTVEKIGNGPIVICVDESASMDGEPICQAKAIALSMAWIAKHQKRYCALVGFSGNKEGTRLLLPPNKCNEEGLLLWLEHFYRGGTTCDVPLIELPKVYWQEFVSSGMKRGHTDICIITDAMVCVPPEVERDFNLWKQQENVKCYSLIIGTQAGDMKRVSDLVYEMDGLGIEQEAVQKIFQI